MRKICGIYKITNKTNGKIHIGQSVDIGHRWQIHLSSNDDLLFHRALKKYGKEGFSWEIVEECPVEDLNEKEIYYIKKYHSCIYDVEGNGYNMTWGGDGGVK